MSKRNTVGTEMANPVVAPPANGKLVRKGHSKGGSPYPEATKANRSGSLERNGFKGAPQMNHVYPNAPEAQATFRNVRLLPPSRGSQSFYDRRQYGQTGNFG